MNIRSPSKYVIECLRIPCCVKEKMFMLRKILTLSGSFSLILTIAAFSQYLFLPVLKWNQKDASLIELHLLMFLKLRRQNQVTVKSARVCATGQWIEPPSLCEKRGIKSTKAQLNSHRFYRHVSAGCVVINAHVTTRGLILGLNHSSGLQKRFLLGSNYSLAHINL